MGLFPKGDVFAKNTTEECSVFVNIYDDELTKFVLPNTVITLPIGATPIDTLGELKKQKLIVEYALQEGKIMQIDFLDNRSFKTSNDAFKVEIYVKLNGEVLSDEQLKTELSQGDIVEWIYGVKKLPVPTQEPFEEIKPVGKKAIEWSGACQLAMTDACEYLALNKETTTSYLIAMGAAGKTLDVKMINDLLGQIRRTASYPSKTELAKTVISMTFAGYDASELVTVLSDYKGDGDELTLESVYVLLAYDCVNYEVSADAHNARRTLINIILASQNEDGEFFENGKSSMDSIQLTAMAITALSNYQSQDDVKAAIVKGVDFLAKSQTQKGNFLLNGDTSTTLLAKVIIGLSSANVGVLDERFIKNEQNMVDTLLSYQNADGGFMESGGEASSSTATEQAVIALSAAKKNAYPYSISHSLIKMNKTPAEKLKQDIGVLSVDMIILIAIASAISLFAIIASFICKGIKRKSSHNSPDKTKV